MTIKTPIILILYSTILLGIYAFSRWSSPGPTYPSQHTHGEPLEKLDLTEDQRQQLKELRQRHRPEIAAKRKIVDEGINEIEDMLRRPAKDEVFQKELEEKFKKLESDKYEMHLKRFQLVLEIRKILNDDQLKNFQGMNGPLRRPQH